MTETHGRKPRTTRKLIVRLRNGWIAGPYAARQLIWDDRGQEGDVIAAEIVA